MQKRPSITYLTYRLSANFPMMAEFGQESLPERAVAEGFCFHDCARILLCREGRGVLETELDSFPFEAGDVLFLSPFLVYRLYQRPERHMTKESRPPCRLEAVVVDLEQIYNPDFFAALLERVRQLQVPMAVPPVYAKEAYEQLPHLTERMLEELREKKKYYQMSVRGYLLAFLSGLWRGTLGSELYPKGRNQGDVQTGKGLLWGDGRSAERRNDGEGKGQTRSAENAVWERRRVSLYPALRLMDTDYARKLSIPELAQVCGLSETHFRRLFRENFGMSPLEYLTRLRIRRSCAILCRQPLQISQVAEMTGFPTLSSYNRKFLEIMGMPPSKWVKTECVSHASPTKLASFKVQKVASPS